MVHGLQGPHSREDRDAGCYYSEGKLCSGCPFLECVEDLDNGERIRFGLAFKEDGAKEWRKGAENGKKEEGI